MLRVVFFLLAMLSVAANAAAPAATAVQVATGGIHSCLLTAAGGVKCWGAGSQGQLGENFLTTSRPNPVDVLGLQSGVIAITAGGRHTCALTNVGGVKCWGDNNEGQLGNANWPTDSDAPTDVTGLNSGVASISAGYEHTCAVMSLGTVKCWGNPLDGRLGNTVGGIRGTVFNVTGLTGVATVSAGFSHTCVVTTGTGAKCWGNNGSGQLGDGTFNTQLNPVNVTAFTSGVATISAGDQFTCVLTISAAAKCWGSGSLGSLGDPIYNYSVTSPVQVLGLDAGVISVSAGGGQACAVMIVGGLKCWGRGNYGQVGNNSYLNATLASLAIGLGSNLSTVAPGGTHSCAVTSSGGVKCWGENSAGQLGDGSTFGRPYPDNVAAFAREIPSITSGTSHACAVNDVGAAYCWGYNEYLKLGNASLASFATYPAPRPVLGLASPAKMISLGLYHSCALIGTGAACWGSDFYGEIGDGGTIPGSARATPVPVSGAGVAMLLSTGGSHACVVTSSGSVRCWGRNNRGQLGTGNNTSASSAQSTFNLGRTIAIAAGGEHTCLLTELRTVYCWGANELGQLGRGTTTDGLFPLGVSGISGDVMAISAGEKHTCALTLAGVVWCWGANGSYQLNQIVVGYSPVPIASFGGAIAMSAGKEHTCILTPVGAVQCAGSNAEGELGLGLIDARRTNGNPVAQFASGVAAIAAGAYASFALIPDGTAYGWGSSYLGRLGNGANRPAFPLPAQVLGTNGAGVLYLKSSDTIADQFTLQSRFGVGRGASIDSNPVTVSGITSAAPVTITGGLISIDGGAYFAGPGSVANSGTVRVRVTASMNYDTLSVATLNVGGQSASFQVRTRKNPNDPVVVPAIALGENFTLLLGSNGLVYAAGYNGTRQMGNGSTLNATAHAPVAGLTNIRRIAAGSNHALALRADGTVVAWGYNAAGQLGGAGAANSSGYPTQVAVLTGIIEIAAGQNHSLALKSDNTLWAWGLNAEGQLGTGNTLSTATPVQVLTGVQSIAAGARHTLAIKTNGTLWSWGANEAGQLGSGNTTPRSTPTQVGVITNWLALAAGNAHALALRADGTVYSWGANNKGQLGDGTIIGKTAPTFMATLSAIASIAAGAEHSLALRVGGIAYTWGANDASQLGDGLIALRNTPFQIPNQGNLIAVAGGGAHSAALTKFGEVLVWGRNDDGQIGNRNSGTKGGPETIDTGKGRPAVNPIARVQKVSPPPGSSNSINSSSGTAVLVIKKLGYLSNDFGVLNLGAATQSTYTYTNQSVVPNGSLINGLGVSVSGTDFSLLGSTCMLSLSPGDACEFDVYFVPAAAGDRQGTLVIDSDIAGSPQQFTLYGTGAAANTPAMTLGVAELRFAARSLGTSEIETFLVGNDGTANLSVSSASSNLADFGVSHNCTSVAPAATCSVTVNFIPAASGARTATLTLTSNAGTQTVALSGAGVNAIVDIDPAPFTFTAQNSGTVATLQTSNTITVSGIDSVAPVAVTNGEFSIGCNGTFITGTGTISNGQTICVRHTSASTISTTNTTTLKIGAVSGQFTTTTANTPLYSFGIVKSGAGSGNIAAISPIAPALNCGATCNANYNAGTAIELIATPAAGSVLTGWTGCDAANGIRCNVTLNASRNVTATFIASAATVPGAPVIGTPTAGNTQATLAYTAPMSNGGSAITHYTATCNPGAFRAISTSGGNATPITITGLANATLYTCSVTASNAAGTSAASSTVNVTPQASVPFALIGVQSRKLHAGAGEYDVPIDTAPLITGNVSVEPRATSAAHRIVFQFSGPVTQSGTATAVDVNSIAIGSVGGTRAQDNEAIVTLTNIPDASRVKVILANVNGAGVGGQASIGFLVGDTNQTARLNAADISGAKAHVAQIANGGNFRFDANGDGIVDAKDVSMVKVRAGLGLP